MLAPVLLGSQPHMLAPVLLGSGPSAHASACATGKWAIRTCWRLCYWEVGHPHMLAPVLLVRGPVAFDNCGLLIIVADTAAIPPVVEGIPG